MSRQVTIITDKNLLYGDIIDFFWGKGGGGHSGSMVPLGSHYDPLLVAGGLAFLILCYLTFIISL